MRHWDQALVGFFFCWGGGGKNSFKLGELIFFFFHFPTFFGLKTHFTLEKLHENEERILKCIGKESLGIFCSQSIIKSNQSRKYWFYKMRYRHPSNDYIIYLSNSVITLFIHRITKVSVCDQRNFQH
ncbi:hypothetical protein FGIG_10300 [Fasciola gigantica]|uniref:Uncharacterized protein n=1 Tax=Fasciola gigantica TaxID=46835 RepID=A0A504Y502_FASGI|nr:hypothetical protein FGIG_10300 [Fasciola gigantica]